jgi:beta-1,2-mannobiose phosphorylase / 1,2-beta-oligomannan phosphorylase
MARSPLRLPRCPANPILRPDPASAWESLVRTNPAVWQDDETGKIMMLYRAAGDDAEHRVHFGLAESDDGIAFRACSPEPCFSPSADGFDAGCVEDPRVVRIGDWYYVTYAARAFPPGRYWLKKPTDLFTGPGMPADAPRCLRLNTTTTGLALTKDFKTWIRAGRITSPVTDDRDVILFPEKVGGRYAMLHRPMEWAGPGYPNEHPAIWISYSDDLLDWKASRLLCQGEADWEPSKIGGNTPPLRTPRGWLTIYHAVGPDKKYRLGALLLDLEEPHIVRSRLRDWLLEPVEDYEVDGFYPGVCFPCGKLVRDGKLWVYYGGADRYVALATCDYGALLETLHDRYD